jgi:hypothetical protein
MGFVHPDRRAPRMTLGGGWTGPSDVDLGAKLRPILDQGQVGGCVGASGARVLSQWEKNLSWLYGYTATRIFEKEPLVKDDGCIIGDYYTVAEAGGIATEAHFSDAGADGRVAEVPSADAVADAAKHRVQFNVRVETTDEAMACLAQGFCVQIGIAVPANMMDTGTDGVVHYPSATEQIVGQHAICVEGYSTSKFPGKKMLLCGNSWNTSWGWHGRFWLPATFIDHALASDGHSPRMMRQ